MLIVVMIILIPLISKMVTVALSGSNVTLGMGSPGKERLTVNSSSISGWVSLVASMKISTVFSILVELNVNE